MTASRSSGGSSTTTSGPKDGEVARVPVRVGVVDRDAVPAGMRGVRHRPGPSGAARRPRRARTRSVAVWSLACGLSQSLTSSRTSVPSGTLTLPGGPASLTGPVMRLSRNTRGALRVAVVAGDVPAAAPVDHAPRLEGPLGRLGAAARLVVEGDRPAVADRLPQRAERGLLRASAAAGCRAAGWPSPSPSALPARRPQLERRARRGAGQLGRLPDAGRDAEHGRLVRLQVDLGQLVVLAADPVAEVVVERRWRGRSPGGCRGRAAPPCPARTCA